MLEKEDLEKSLDRIQDWIKSADEKIGILLALETALFTFLFLNFFRWFENNRNNFKGFELVFLVVAIIFAVLSFFKLLIALMPRLGKKDSKKSFTYFGDVANFTLEDYGDLIKTKQKSDYVEELVKQIHINAGISTKKHQAFRKGLIHFVWFLITTLILVIGKKFLW